MQLDTSNRENQTQIDKIRAEIGESEACTHFLVKTLRKKIPQYLADCRSANPQKRQDAAKGLYNFMPTEEFMAQLRPLGHVVLFTIERLTQRTPGIIEGLVGLLRDDRAKTREHATAALARLAHLDANKLRIASTPGAIEGLVGLLRDDNGGIRFNAMETLSNLTRFLNRSPCGRNQVWVGGTPGAIEGLISLLGVDNKAKVREGAADALSWLARDNPENQFAIAKAPGFVEQLVILMGDSSSAALRALESLKESIGKSPEAISGLMNLLRNSHAEIRKNTARALDSLAKNNPENQLAMATTPGAIVQLVALLRDPAVSVAPLITILEQNPCISPLISAAKRGLPIDAEVAALRAELEEKRRYEEGGVDEEKHHEESDSSSGHSAPAGAQLTPFRAARQEGDFEGGGVYEEKPHSGGGGVVPRVVAGERRGIRVVAGRRHIEANIEREIELLQAVNPSTREDAARQLLELAQHPDNGNFIREAGGIGPLVRVVRNNHSANAAGVLAYLAKVGDTLNTSNQNAIREAGAIPILVALLNRGSTHYNIIGALGSLVANNFINQNAVREAGAIPILIDLLTRQPTNKLNILGALGYLAENNLANQNAIREAGGIEPLVQLLGDSDSSISGNANYTLNDLAKGNPTNAAIIAEREMAIFGTSIARLETISTMPVLASTTMLGSSEATRAVGTEYRV